MVVYFMTQEPLCLLQTHMRSHTRFEHEISNAYYAHAKSRLKTIIFFFVRNRHFELLAITAYYYLYYLTDFVDVKIGFFITIIEVYSDCAAE